MEVSWTLSSELHGKHNKGTISFRVSNYERQQIEQKVKLSGIAKQDYIARSCIYNRVCVVGKKETVELIRKELQLMYAVLGDIREDLKNEVGNISMEGLQEIREEYQALLEALLWLLEGSRYLWEGNRNDRE